MAAAAAPGSISQNTYSARFAAAVTPDDSTVLLETRGIYVGAAGDLAVTMAGDTGDVTFVAVPAGTTLAIGVTKVLSTGTDAASIVAMW